MTADLMPLADAERAALTSHEATIERGLATFVDVGNALLAIRDGRLYRQAHGTFEDYCRERWGLKQSRAYQLMDAAAAIGNLKSSTIVELPANEAQARPLAALPPAQQPVAWQRAVETAPNGRPTGAHVARTVRSMTAGDADGFGDGEFYEEPAREAADDLADGPEPKPAPVPTAEPFIDRANRALGVVAAADPNVRAANAALAFADWLVRCDRLMVWDPEEMAAALPPSDFGVMTGLPKLDDWLARFRSARRGPRLVRGGQ